VSDGSTVSFAPMHIAALSLLVLTPALAQQRERIPVLIVSGANNHDWEYTSPSLERMLEASGLFDATITTDPAGTLADATAIIKFKAFVLDYNGPRWGSAAEKNFLSAVRGGKGVCVIHAANNAFPGWTEYETLVGHLWREDNDTGHGKFHAFDVTVFDREHPITRGLFDLRAHHDELYHRLWQSPGSNHRILASAWSTRETDGSGAAEPMLTVGSYGEGRVFHTPLGHVGKDDEASRASHADRQFQELIVRGTEWAATGDCSGRATTANLLTKEEHEAGWKLLFDGFSPQGWRGYRRKDFPELGWKVEQGALTLGADGGGGDLVTTAEYGDFELEFDWKVGIQSNSGVIYRVGEDAEASYMSGPEYQVIDDSVFGDKPSPDQSAGALYALAAPEDKLLLPVGGFNRGKVVVQGWRIEHWLNGRLLLTCDLAGEDGRERIAASKFKDMPLFASLAHGLIALQDHGDSVAYRSIKVRELDGGRSPDELFNGRDLKGWRAFLEGGGDAGKVWSVTTDGILVCSGTPNGYLYTEQQFTNYVLDFDWRWDPATKKAGNSGVLLRIVEPHKVWPKCLEAQLQSGSAGDFWRIDDFPATTFPERTQGRNAKHSHQNERPVGEWNHYRISVDRGVVTLEVNGAEVNQAVGVLEVAGSIGLQSEGTPIHFRNIVLTPRD
jgi:type 1 glutamine amidotransferase